MQCTSDLTSDCTELYYDIGTAELCPGQLFCIEISKGLKNV